MAIEQLLQEVEVITFGNEQQRFLTTNNNNNNN